MKEIHLNKGKVALVDDEDFVWLSQYKWYAFPSNNKWYAHRKDYDYQTKERKTILMHREIMDTPAELEVDHKDGNGLNNQKENMRNCTTAQNIWNSKKKRGASGYIGVHKTTGKYNASITVNGKVVYLGRFGDPIRAAKAYDNAAIKYHGEFAVLNFPEDFLIVL